LARELQAGTGSRVLHVPVPGGAMVALGRLADRFRRFAPAVLDSVSAGSMTYLTRMPPADSSPVQRELGVDFRPLAETLEPLCEEIVRRRRGETAR
ncbi:MAG TPA: hypothetical protein VLA56_20585, partial [Pseudomonadales bacterium]|nr:hypothetical protein [Pseudomonadales bacterium]